MQNGGVNVGFVSGAAGNNVGLALMVKTFVVRVYLHAFRNACVVLVIKNNNFRCVGPALN
jgi:hypothetical protein